MVAARGPRLYITVPAGHGVCRFLFILGHLLRYGLDTLDAAEQPAERAVTTEGCCAVFLAFFNSTEPANGQPAALLPAPLDFL